MARGNALALVVPVLVSVAAVMAGCIETSVTACADGLVCPDGRVCVLDQCIERGRLDACQTAGAGAPCVAAGQPGVCQAVGDLHVCLAGCGDAVVAQDEDCDPGNQASAPTCEAAGFYQGISTCADDCKVDLSACAGYCGDGEVTGPEFCDGASPVASCDVIGGDYGVPACPSDCSRAIEGCGIIGWRTMLSEATVAVDGAGGLNLAVTKSGGIYQRRGDFYERWLDLSMEPTALAMSSATSALVVGNVGKAFFFDGTSWAEHSTGSEQNLNAVYTPGNGEYWVVGNGGTVLRFDGETWWSGTGLPETESASNFNTVSGWSASEIYIGGDSGVVYRWDGSGWSMFAETEIVYGNQGTVSRLAATGSGTFVASIAWPPFLVYGYLFDGSDWLFIPGSALLTSVTASASGVIVTGSVTGVVRLFDGATWTDVSNQGNQIHDLQLEGRELIAASEAGVRRFTGSLWRGLDPSTDAATAYYFRSHDDYFSLTEGGQFRHMEGGAGAIEDIDPSATLAMTSLWCSDTDDCFAAGLGGKFYHRAAPSGPWTQVPLPLFENAFASSAIAKVFGTSETDVWLVGSRFAYGSHVRGLVFHYDGSNFVDYDKDALQTGGAQAPFLFSGAAFSPDNVLVVGEGKAFRYDGSQWTSEDLPIIATRLAATSPSDVMVAGADGKVARWDGAAWTVEQTPTSVRLTSLWRNGDDDILAGGWGGVLVHFDGVAWSLVNTPAFDTIPAIVGTRRKLRFGGSQPWELERLSRWRCADTEVNPSDDVDDDCDGSFTE